AVDLATANVAAGGGPFGAVIVLPGGRVIGGVNRVTAAHDPTAHAEVMAIRKACRLTGGHELRGAVLHASCGPCPRCRAPGLWARTDGGVSAAGRDAAARAGFDDATIHDVCDSPVLRGRLPTAQFRDEESLAPFAAWRASEDRIE